MQVDKNNFEFLYIIGRGGFGKVWKAKLKSTGDIFAIKVMSKIKIITKHCQENVKRERNILTKLNNPFIVNMYFAFQDSLNLYLIIDFLSGGDLRYHLIRKKNFTENETKFFILNIIIALEYVHNHKIIHRDVKPENLVFEANGYLRITDFGVAKKKEDSNSNDTSGTPGYMAPEVIFMQGHSYSADYFALGVIGYEIMLGRRPYNGKNRKQIKENIICKQAKIKYDEKPFEWTEKSMDFINKLLQRKPCKRLGFNGIKEIKDHPWIREAKWNLLKNKNLEAPFIPKQNKNLFGKKYCQGIENSIVKYNEFIKEDSMINVFIDYTFINLNIINKYKREYNFKNNKKGNKKNEQPIIRKTNTIHISSKISQNINKINENNEDKKDNNINKVNRRKNIFNSDLKFKEPIIKEDNKKKRNTLLETLFSTKKIVIKREFKKCFSCRYNEIQRNESLCENNESYGKKKIIKNKIVNEKKTPKDKENGKYNNILIRKTNSLNNKNQSFSSRKNSPIKNIQQKINSNNYKIIDKSNSVKNIKYLIKKNKKEKEYSTTKEKTSEIAENKDKNSIINNKKIIQVKQKIEKYNENLLKEKINNWKNAKKNINSEKDTVLKEKKFLSPPDFPQNNFQNKEIGNISPLVKPNTSKFIRSKSFNFINKKKEIKTKNKNEINTIRKSINSSKNQISSNLVKSDNKILFHENAKNLGYEDYFKSTKLKKKDDNKINYFLLNMNSI